MMESPAPKTSLARMTLAGVAAGALASLAVLAFRWCIEAGQATFLPGGRIGNYEALPPLARLLLPTLGGLALGFVFARLPRASQGIGVVHVLERIHQPDRGRLPPANAVVQFLGGAAAIISGHSVDREGPGVHIGAASANLLARIWPHAPAEDNRTLMACGIAASLAAAFNTPLAGVLFVIEVLRVPYRIVRFFPVIMAAVVGAVISRAVHGPSPAFAIPPIDLGSLAELPWIAIMGAAAGLAAMGFVAASETILSRTLAWSPVACFTLAGACTGALALVTPQIMGISYDTLEQMLHGRLALELVAALIVTKLVATAISIGLRVPGGLIGPMLVIGGAIGSAAGLVAHAWFPAHAGTTGFYAVIGMVAMLGAALRAPMTALIALLELTANPNIILPGMLAVLSANLANLLLLGKESVFVAQERILRRTGGSP